MQRDMKQLGIQMAEKAMRAALDSIESDLQSLGLSQSDKEGAVATMSALSMLIHKTIVSARVSQAIHLKPEALPGADELTMKIVKTTMGDNGYVAKALGKLELMQMMALLMSGQNPEKGN